jgi:hypothetical protein
MIRMTFSRFVPVLLVAALLSAAPAATAAPPERDKPENINFLVPKGEGCEDFALRVEGTASNANILTFRDENGEIVRTITAGRGYTLTYSRLDAKGNVVDSLTLKPTGSVQRVEVAPDGTQTVVGTGTNGLILFSSDESEIGDTPLAVQYTGRIVYTIDPVTGVFTLLSASGKELDLCEALA